MIPEVQVTELLGTLAMLAEVSGLVEGISIFPGTGFKREVPPVPGDAESGDEKLLDFPGDEADSLLYITCVAPTFHGTSRRPNP